MIVLELMGMFIAGSATVYGMAVIGSVLDGDI